MTDQGHWKSLEQIIL